MKIVDVIIALNKPKPENCRHGSYTVMKDTDGLITVKRCNKCGKDCRNEPTSTQK